MSFISSLDLTSFVYPDANFLWITASTADAAAVNPNVINTFLFNGASTFVINVNLAFVDGPMSPPDNLPDCIILDS